MHVGDRKWDLKEASDILVTLSEELNVIVPAKDPNSTIYIDVPLESILEVSFDKEFLTDSQNPTYRVIIQLIDRVATNCTLNATEYAERHVALAFASENDANTLRRLLMSTNVQTDGFSPQSQSAATEVLEPILSDDELAGPGPALSHSQILMRTASVASALIPHRNEVCTINPLRLERAHTSQGASAEHREGSSSSMIEQDEDSQKVCHSVKMADEGIDVSDDGSWVMKAFEGIDVSQIGGLSHDETQHQDFQAPAPNNTSSIARVLYSQPLSNEKQEPKGGFDRSSDTGLSSSLRRQPGLNAIQNASDFGAQVPQHAVSPVEQVKKASRPEYQDGEYNELYDASPKVNHGQRRSPRNTAQDNLLQRLERLQKPASRQTSVNTGPHTKLSKQLRNANGIVESHTEQTVDNGLAPLTKNGAGDVKTSGDRKKSKIPVHTKVRTRKKEPTKSTKKTSQIKGKATTTEESSKAAFDNYDSPPSPTHADSIQAPDDKKKATATRPKVARVPRNKQEQAKPISAKAAATNSSKGPTLQLKKGSKDKAKTKGSIQDSAARRLDGKMLDNDDDAIWDFDQAHSGENPQLLRQSGQPTKTARKREVSVPKTKEDRAQTLLHPGKAKANKATKAQTQGPKGRVTKAKPAPAVLSQPRSRRAAAIKANKKIQGLDESDDIVDDEDVVPVLTRGNRNASSDAAKVPKIPKVRGGGDSRATSHGKLPTAKFPVQYSTPDSVSPDSLEGQRSGSVSHPKALSSAKKVDLVRDAPAEAFRAAHSDTLHKENPTSAAETSIIPLHSRDGDKSDQPNSASVEKGVEMSEARVDLVPGSVSRLYKSITETGATPTLPLKRDDVNQGEFNPTKTAGPGDQEPAEHVLPHTDDVLFELDLKSDRVAEEVNPSRAPTAPTVVEPRQRRRSPRLAAAAPKSLPEATTTRSDPFGAKLKDTNTKVKSRDGHANVKSKEANTPKPAKPAELARSSREPKASAFNGLEASSFEEAKQVKNPRRYLKSAIQVDGEGGDSLIQMLKPAREPISASKGENKRRTEQVGDTSSKRVKAAAHERLERPSAKREPADDAKKTPPPVVSNRPLVIGFSRSGPRNQGTVSMKKPEPPTHVRTGAPGAGFASVRGALREPPEDIAHNLDATQKKARGSPPRKQPEHLETVNAVATREPNTQEHRAQKRKLHPFLDEPAPWEHEQLLKRQKRDVETPPSPHTHHPNMLPDASPSVIHDRSQRLGSQHTRVNENGSPMPFLITRHEETAAEEHYSDEDDGNNALAEARLEDPNVLQEDDPILPEPIFPLVPVESTSKIKTKVHESLSNNSKQVPSSPHAPSVFGAMPPHHIYHDGEIVNAETKESIIPVKPQDPFLGAAQNLQNPFMNALRKSTEIAAKRLIPGAKEKGGSRVVVVRPSLNMGEDPDKTLVEPKLREKYKQVHVSEASSSSHSSFSSQASSQPGESSEEESDGETEANWRKGLEPHQENMLECLLTISHVSNYT